MHSFFQRKQQKIRSKEFITVEINQIEQPALQKFGVTEEKTKTKARQTITIILPQIKI